MKRPSARKCSRGLRPVVEWHAVVIDVGACSPWRRTTFDWGGGRAVRTFSGWRANLDLVRATLRLDRRATYAEYLAAERLSPVRHEYIDGVIVAMAGGSDEHNAIMMQVGVLCANRGSGHCRVYPADQRFWIAATGRGRYSDGSIICGAPRHPPHDSQATTNPAVVFEVLSPSSEGDDEGDKRLDFQSLESLEAYVVVAQDDRCVRVYRRDDRGAWRRDPCVYRDGESFELPTLAAAIEVTEVYEGIVDAAGRSLLR
jgi:Uma2 family endonuclease